MRELLSVMGSDEFEDWKTFFKLSDNPNLLNALTKKQSPDQIKGILAAVASNKVVVNKPKKKRKKK